MDLQRDSGFLALDVALLSISPDSVEAWAVEVSRRGIETPALSDAGNRVARAYGVMRWAMPSGEPGHTFVLVDANGRVRWLRDYGAPENGGLMYVPVADLVREIRDGLDRSG